MKIKIRNIFNIILVAFVLMSFHNGVFAAEQNDGQNLTVTVDNSSIIVPDTPIIAQVDNITTSTVDLDVKVGSNYANEMLEFVVTITNLFTGDVTTANYTQATNASSETTLGVVGLDPGTQYQFEVRYRRSGDVYSDDSSPVNATTLIDAPVLDSVDAVTDSTADLHTIIDPAFVGATMDFIIAVTDGDGNTYTVQMTQNVTSINVILPVDDLDSNTDYTFKVKYAREGTLNFSDYSNEKSITTENEVDLSRPIIESIDNVTTHSMDLLVDTGDHNNKDMDLVVRVVNESTGETFTVNFSKTTDSNGKVILAITGLDPDTVYTFKVKYSLNGDDRESAYSPEKSQKTNAIDVVEPTVEICNNNSTIVVLQSELQSYLDQGAIVGPCEAPKDIRVVICYNDSTISILQSEVQSYINDGATIGQCTISGGSTTVDDQNTSIHDNDIKNKIAPQESKNIYETIAGIGAFAGASIALAGSAVPLFAAMPGAFGNSVFLHFLELFGIIGRRKEERNWGVVFDVQTHMPIPAVKIVLLDQMGKEMATTYSDKDGRFGFLVNPGTYVINVFKKNYTLVTEMGHDDIYGNLYDGKEITIKEDHVMLSNIAMKSENINWQEYAAKKSKQYKSKWSIVKKYFFTSMYFIGFVATAIITYFYPSIFNFVMLGVYVMLFIYQKFFNKKKYGVIETHDGKPIPFAIVNLYDKKTNEKQNFAVTDSIGRYYLLSDNGKYDLKAKGQPVSGTSFEKVGDIHVTDGIVRKDIIV